jgi:hypothetical protein
MEISEGWCFYTMTNQDGELGETATCKEFLQVQTEGTR